MRKVTLVKIHESGPLGIPKTAIFVSIPAIFGPGARIRGGGAPRKPESGVSASEPGKPGESLTGMAEGKPEARGRTSVTLLGQNRVTRRRQLDGARVRDALLAPMAGRLRLG